MSVYTELKAAGCQLEHHESDLYVRSTPEARAIVVKHLAQYGSAIVFKDDIDGNLWVSIPFAYDPFWEGGKDA